MVLRGLLVGGFGEFRPAHDSSADVPHLNCQADRRDGGDQGQNRQDASGEASSQIGNAYREGANADYRDSDGPLPRASRRQAANTAS